jgi:hypothetical protein
MREWFFITDSGTFKGRYEIVQQDGLRASGTQEQ